MTRGDVALAQELLRRADIAIENFRPGSLAKFGLDYPSAEQLNARLIYLSITGFGTADGAWLPGYDLVVQAVSGLMSLTGEPDGPAYRSGVAVFDVMTGLHGTIGVLAALQPARRNRPWPARRGQSAVVGVVRTGQSVRRLHRWGSGTAAHGQCAPERLPLSADADEGS